MLVDYEFYKNNFKGKLSAEEFDKFVNLSCMKITKETCSRVTDGTLNNFPNELILDIKTCVCALIDKLKIFQDALDFNEKSVNSGAVKSQTAGTVSVTYDTSFSSYFLDSKNQEIQIKSIINAYLFPRCINGKFYNLLSKIIENSNSCKTCSLV